MTNAVNSLTNVDGGSSQVLKLAHYSNGAQKAKILVAGAGIH